MCPFVPHPTRAQPPLMCLRLGPASSLSITPLSPIDSRFSESLPSPSPSLVARAHQCPFLASLRHRPALALLALSQYHRQPWRVTGPLAFSVWPSLARLSLLPRFVPLLKKNNPAPPPVQSPPVALILSLDFLIGNSPRSRDLPLLSSRSEP